MPGEIPSDSPLWDVWASIKGFYPSSTANWDSEPPLIWAHTLNGLTMDQLINGVKNLVHHQDERGNNSFPPNAGQFKDLCLTNFEWERQCHKIYRADRRIEDISSKEKSAAAAKVFFAEQRGLR